MLSQKIRKMGRENKHWKTQDILMVGGLSWGYVGPSWGYVGLSWGYVGPSRGYLGPSWGLCWPILGAMLAHLGAILAHLGGHVGPSWGLCWPILRPMLAHVDPSGATNAEKWEKMRRAQNTVKRDCFFGGGEWVAGRGRGPSLLRRGEKPSARTRPGGPWPDLSAYARQPARGPTM